ncbi:hypothetical protein D9613_005257 [Agrocybe pediades]|uniref:CCD97-like C-terminal domain-containing protein n=1 Tax=Agrocybe pediades TaxID=84607 RepID=A0A8H4QYI8_9AGAR|nr:hypothetical protein D9613_005257 [Agrocybe pediades]
MSAPVFDKAASLKYLGLPLDFEPSPDKHPIEFLTRYIAQLPPHILIHYNTVTTPKQRTTIPAIRNRRLQYTLQNPPELRFESARNTWPELWQGRERRGKEEGEDERAWAQRNFLQGTQQHVGKLANLLAEYEEEREAERIRELRRSRAPAQDEFVPEEDSDSDEEDEEDERATHEPPEEESPAQAKASFERLLRERFIYGLLDNIDYDKVDWDETLGVEHDREAEERWFEESDED